MLVFKQSRLVPWSFYLSFHKASEIVTRLNYFCRYVWQQYVFNGFNLKRYYGKKKVLFSHT